jgi:hypothetical protein
LKIRRQAAAGYAMRAAKTELPIPCNEFLLYIPFRTHQGVVLSCHGNAGTTANFSNIS